MKVNQSNQMNQKNHSTNKLVPRLRFKEFQKYGSWEEIELAFCLKTESSIIALNKLQFLDEGFPVYGADGFIGNILSYTQKEPYIAIIKDGSGVGKLFFYEGHSSILGTLAYLKTQDEEKYRLRFLFNLMHTINLSNYVKGSGIPHIYFSDYSKEKIAIPSLPEQQKIADTLSSLDELISAETEKLEALKTHKKGLMQQLFPAAGEAVPKLRFPEFKNSGDWEEKKLGEVCEINPSNDGLPNNFVYIDLESVEGGVLLQKKKINLNEAPSRAQRLLQKGDIIFQTVRPYQQNNLLFKIDDGFMYVASTGYAQLRAFDSEMFLFQSLYNDFFLHEVLAKSTGSNYPAININALSKIPLFFPKLLEQQKIASCLSSLDEWIAAQQEKIEALRLHKKGLMQGLFPAMT